MKPASRKNRIIIGFVIALLTGLALQFFHAGEALDRKILDFQFEYLRAHYPQPVKNDVVIVGIDENAFKAFREPFALWHPHLGEFLKAMALARPAVVGLDIVLPERSYHFLIPQYDQPLLQGLAALRTQSPIVLAQTLDDNGQFRPIFPPYISMAGSDPLASVMVCTDSDGVVRHFDETLCAPSTHADTLAGKMAAHLNLKQSWHGLVDYSVGDAFQYIPLLQVLEWYEQGKKDELAKAFGGKPVLLGAVLPFSDRLNIPATLAAWEPLNHHLPGVLLHGQVLRSMQNHGLIQESSSALLLLLAASAALLWFGRGGFLKFSVFVLFVAGALALSLMQLWQSRYLPVGSVLFSGTFALVARMSYEALIQMKERRMLRGTFGSYVSPQILQEIMSGNIKPGLGGMRKRVCVLFSDIRNFTTRSENLPPEEVITLLNGYFTEMTAAVHQHGGTVDKFIGDGMMCFFGAPQTLACPEKNALETAQEMLVRLGHYNRKLKDKGIEPVMIGIGIHVGEVIIGHVGSESRHEYTAIGDVVNTASRLEGITKTLGYPVICSQAVSAAVGYAGGLVDLGEQPIKGHTAIPVYGWNPPVLGA